MITDTLEMDENLESNASKEEDDDELKSFLLDSYKMRLFLLCKQIYRAEAL